MHVECRPLCGLRFCFVGPKFVPKGVLINCICTQVQDDGVEIEDTQERVWKKQLADFKANIGQEAFNRLAWTNRPHIRLSGVAPLPRTKAMIDMAWLSVLSDALGGDLSKPIDSRMEEDLARDLVVNYSQSYSRRAWGRLGTLTTSTLLYHYGLDRQILPAEQLFFLGWPRSVANAPLGDNRMREMAGEGQSLPCCALGIGALVHNALLPGLWSISP